MRNLKYILIALLTLNLHFSFAQDSNKMTDSLLIVQHTNLISAKITNRNAIDYFNVAEALWNTKSYDKASLMLKNIINSKKRALKKTYKFPSKTRYSYGRYTKNYKNSAAKMLATIAIAQKRYKEAVYYLDLMKGFPVNNGCGTIASLQESKIHAYYAQAFLGLEDIDKAINYILDDCFYCKGYGNCELLQDIIRKNYNREKIIELRDKAFKNILYEQITIGDNEYLKGYIILFDKKMIFQPKEIAFFDSIDPVVYFTKEFKKTTFYKQNFLFGKVTFE